MTPRCTILSPDRVYRYQLWREWGMQSPNFVAFIGLNPSTADETADDPTIRRCIGFAKAWGYGALCMLNLFAYRATLPTGMMAVEDPVGPENLLMPVCEHADRIIAAWGVHGAHRGRGEEVRKLLARNVPLYHLGLTKDGHPKHPLYLKANTIPQPWGIAAAPTEGRG